MTKKLIQYQCSVCDEIHETEAAADECCVVKIDEKFEAFKIAAKEIADSATHPKELFERAEKLIQEYTDNTTFKLTYTCHYRKRESYKDSAGKDLLSVVFTTRKHLDRDLDDVISYSLRPLFGICCVCGNGNGDGFVKYQGEIRLSVATGIANEIEKQFRERTEYYDTVYRIRKKLRDEMESDSQYVHAQGQVEYYQKVVDEMESEIAQKEKEPISLIVKPVTTLIQN